MKTVLITGSSSGIGKAAVIAFAAAEWQVAATMRITSSAAELSTMNNVSCFALDVTSEESIKTAFAEVLAQFGHLDAVVNNAGYGLDGVFEAMKDEQIQKQFDTNVFGLMRVTRQAIAIMREQKSGTIIQISSMGGRVAFPLYSIYHASKWAVEGFSESLQFELAPFNVKVKIVEPGAINTEFYGRSRELVKPEGIHGYDTFIAKVEKISQGAGAKGEDASTVAKMIVKAAEDKNSRLRYVVGKPAPQLLWLRRRLPDSWFFKLIKTTYKL